MKFTKLLQESQFHGGRRLAEGNFRWCWSISLLILFGSAVTVICVTVRRFLDNPTFMVQMESVERFVEFPSVLVCPEIMFRDDKIDTFLSHVKIPPNLNRTYLKRVINQLGAFFSPDVVFKIHDLLNVEHLLEFNDMDVDTAGRLLTTSCRSTLIRCRWQSIVVDCSSLFHMELTGDGYCCVFNGRALSRNMNEKHHDDSHKKWYAANFGYDSGLMLAVNQSQVLFDVDLSYKWLALQSSQHYVESTNNGSALNPGSEQWMEYHIQNFQITDDARSLSDSLKKCREAKEPLTFFPLYNKKYCLVECNVAHTLETCDCVRVVHPRPKGASYCNAQQLRCAQHAMVTYDNDECNCLSSCDVPASYVKISNFKLLESVQPIDTFYDGLDFEKVTVARVFINTRKVKTNFRWPYFSNIDLFSQLGGVFNVFFGCSILTLLELCMMAYRGFMSKIPAVKAKAKLQSIQKPGKVSKKIGKMYNKKLKLKF